MQNDKKLRLKQKLSRLNGAEQRKLYKRAARLRKAAADDRRRERRRRRRRGSLQPEEDSMAFEKRLQRPSESLHDLVLELLAEDERPSADAASRPGDREGAREGTVVWVGAGVCRVNSEGKELPCLLPPDLAMTQKSGLAVGDRVMFSCAGLQDGRGRLMEVLPRITVLSRPDPHNQHLERVIAANIDRVVVVVSVKDPPLRPRLIDRFLIAIERGGAQPLICINKIDLLEGDEEHQAVMRSVEHYREIGVPVVSCSTVTRTGLEELLAELTGRLCAFVGHSGVGKSSLLNAMHPQLGLRIGAVGEGLGKGRHTTSSTSLHCLPGDARVMDTPGIRELGLWQVGAAELKAYFPEIQELAARCRFSDCTHTHEPRCAVKAAAEEGRIPEDRLQSYLRLQQEQA